HEWCRFEIQDDLKQKSPRFRAGFVFSIENSYFPAWITGGGAWSGAVALALFWVTMSSWAAAKPSNEKGKSKALPPSATTLILASEPALAKASMKSLPISR